MLESEVFEAPGYEPAKTLKAKLDAWLKGKNIEIVSTAQSSFSCARPDGQGNFVQTVLTVIYRKGTAEL